VKPEWFQYYDGNDEKDTISNQKKSLKNTMKKIAHRDVWFIENQISKKPDSL